MDQVVTFSFFKFKDWSSRFFALKGMGTSEDILKNVQGLQFYKVLGSGGGTGFSWIPDLSVYGLLCTWSGIEAAEKFHNSSKYLQSYTSRSDKNVSFWLVPFHSHGSWSNVNPFRNTSERKNSTIAVLTRATIKPSKLFAFWKTVKQVGKRVNQSPGKVFSKGIGEWPLLQQATFSIWEDEKSMTDYAYKSDEHLNVIRQTRKKNWFSEELFARFHVMDVTGNWFDGNRTQLKKIKGH
jgi:hypothetical protein